MNTTAVMRHAVRWLTIVAITLPTLAPAAYGDDDAGFSRAKLDQLLAPIALYPDAVLSHVLIAATYPDEVEEAARWSRRHEDLEGEAAVDAVAEQDWHPSVKALVAFPEILARMDEDPEWTATLGDAFLAQEAEVMDAVQGLRRRAYEAGHLGSLEHVRVIREREYIYLEPAVAHVVYVPYYDPWWVYGSWWWASYPPHCWSYWHGRPVRYYASYHHGFYWGARFHVAPRFYFSSFNWPARRVVVVHHHHHRNNHYYSGRDVAQHREARHWREVARAGAGVRRDARRDDREMRPSQRAVARPEARVGRREDRADRVTAPRQRQEPLPSRSAWREAQRDVQRDARPPRGEGLRVRKNGDVDGAREHAPERRERVERVHREMPHAPREASRERSDESRARDSGPRSSPDRGRDRGARPERGQPQRMERGGRGPENGRGRNRDR